MQATISISIHLFLFLYTPSFLYCNLICGQSARGFAVLLITEFTAVEPCREARHLQHLQIPCLFLADIQTQKNICTVAEMIVRVQERIREIKGGYGEKRNVCCGWRKEVERGKVTRPSGLK